MEQAIKEIKPIETMHKGYKFRSRLEARWAIFFEALGIDFEYELEGFYIEDHGNYLPDFYLPDLDCWVEIKPTKISDAVFEKMCDFARIVDPILCLEGSPEFEKMGLLFFCDVWGLYQGEFIFVWCSQCGRAVLGNTRR